MSITQDPASKSLVDKEDTAQQQLKSLIHKDNDTDNEEIKSGGNGSNGDEKVKKNPEEEPKKPVNAGRKLMQYAKKEWCMFIWGTITLVGGNFGQLVIPYYVGLFTDKISNGKFNEVYPLCWQLVLINLVSDSLNQFLIHNNCFFKYQAASICTFARASIFNLMSERVAKSLRGDLYASILNKDVEFFDSRKTGDLCKKPL